MAIQVVERERKEPHASDEEQSPETRHNNNVHAFACHKIPDLAILDQKQNRLSLDVVRVHFLNGGRLTNWQVHKILDDSDEILRREKNVVRIDRKCYIIGDTHGQYYDLISLLEDFDPSRNTLLFLGDYVDRGLFSIEVYLYLLLLKIHFPDNIFILRGNHESKEMTAFFTFKVECGKKYGPEIYPRFLKSFSSLPLAAIVQGRAFCCHGGLSPHATKVRQIEELMRFTEVGYRGVMCDLLWSDPSYDFNSASSGWAFNSKRKCSYCYNKNHVLEFFSKNKLSILFRAHEVQQDGYLLLGPDPDNPLVVTVFSAPNYCDVYKNKGAVVEFDEKIVSIRMFSHADHPFVLKGFIDGISWSVPFVFEKLLDFASAFLVLMNRMQAEESGSEERQQQQPIEILGQAVPVEDIMQPIQEMKENITIMRVEREKIDELEEDEESTLDEQVLDYSRNKAGGFENAIKKDAVNEEKKETKHAASVSSELSPSECQNILASDTIDGIVDGTAPVTSYRDNLDTASTVNDNADGPGTAEATDSRRGPGGFWRKCFFFCNRG